MPRRGRSGVTALRRPARSPPPPTDRALSPEVRTRLPLAKGGPIVQVKPDPQCEYIKEEDVKVKTDADPWMTGTAYGRPFPHPGDEAWGQDQSHAMINISPLLPFETRDLETVDVKEYAWADPEASEVTTTSQTTRATHQTRNGRPRVNPLRIYLHEIRDSQAGAWQSHRSID